MNLRRSSKNINKDLDFKADYSDIGIPQNIDKRRSQNLGQHLSLPNDHYMKLPQEDRHQRSVEIKITENGQSDSMQHPDNDYTQSFHHQSNGNSNAFKHEETLTIVDVDAYPDQKNEFILRNGCDDSEVAETVKQKNSEVTTTTGIAQQIEMNSNQLCTLIQDSAYEDNNMNPTFGQSQPKN